jgi:hypothetical protein
VYYDPEVIFNRIRTEADGDEPLSDRQVSRRLHVKESMVAAAREPDNEFAIDTLCVKGLGDLPSRIYSPEVWWDPVKWDPKVIAADLDRAEAEGRFKCRLTTDGK